MCILLREGEAFASEFKKNLEFATRTRILHCVAGIESLFNSIPNHPIDSHHLYISRGLESNSSLIRSVFLWASSHAYTAIGINSNLIRGAS